ncbi:hypothetical protein CEXT_595221, partial [Caerostris extrusa]
STSNSSEYDDQHMSARENIPQPRAEDRLSLSGNFRRLFTPNWTDSVPRAKRFVAPPPVQTMFLSPGERSYSVAAKRLGRKG